MPKRVGRFTIEHWRDGECIRKVEVTNKMVERSADGTCRVVFPPGTIILNYYGKSFFTGGILLQISLGLALVVLLFVVPVWIKRKNPWGWYDKMTGGDNR